MKNNRASSWLFTMKEAVLLYYNSGTPGVILEQFYTRYSWKNVWNQNKCHKDRGKNIGNSWNTG
jgi:hypothetical protein